MLWAKLSKTHETLMVPEQTSENDLPLLLLVVGAHLRAEIEDRPIATSLRERFLPRLSQAGAPESVVICSDLWYVNQSGLHGLPAVVIGNPAQNAACAWLLRHLPPALVVDQRIQIQADLEWNDLRVCVWGVDAPSTAEAAELFWSRYGEALSEAIRERQEEEISSR